MHVLYKNKAEEYCYWAARLLRVGMHSRYLEIANLLNNPKLYRGTYMCV